MEQDYTKYSDEMLVTMWEEPYDLDENIFFVLGELGSRKHINTKKYCMEVLDGYLNADQFFVSATFSTLYNYDEDAALDYAKEHFKYFHMYSLGTLLSCLWMDSQVERSTKKNELIKLVKEYLMTFKKDKISEIKKTDYDEFMKAYKNL